MVLRRVCVPGKHRALPGSPVPRCWAAGERKHRDFAVTNPPLFLQAKKLETCTSELPIPIPKSPFALLAGPDERKKTNSAESSLWQQLLCARAGAAAHLARAQQCRGHLPTELLPSPAAPGAAEGGTVPLP